jgi:hypothetical protein
LYKLYKRRLLHTFQRFLRAAWGICYVDFFFLFVYPTFSEIITLTPAHLQIAFWLENGGKLLNKNESETGCKTTTRPRVAKARVIAGRFLK